MIELLQELRVVQTGGQIFFAFLLTIAFTPRFAAASATERAVYGWDVFAVAASMAFLVAPVAVHRLNFGRRIRPVLLTIANISAVVGLMFMLAGIVLGIVLISLVVFPDSVWLLPVAAGGVMAACWILLPLAIRLTVPRDTD